MIKYYLESNLMAASPSSHLDSLYADLQMHALNVSDGLAKVLTALGSGSLTTNLLNLHNQHNMTKHNITQHDTI